MLTLLFLLFLLPLHHHALVNVGIENGGGLVCDAECVVSTNLRHGQTIAVTSFK